MSTEIKEDSKTVNVPGFKLPVSSYVSSESLVSAELFSEHSAQLAQKYAELCPSLKEADTNELSSIRDAQEKLFYESKIYEKLKKSYGTRMEEKTIAGVRVQEFFPCDGLSDNNCGRVLINLHGGGFMHGARTNSQLESMPISSVGKIRVISVDYRMAPECRHPAARDDAVAVYSALLEDYDHENIGIYGCSVGGVIAAQVIAWLLQEKLPMPGAIGMFCASAYGWSGGDSWEFVPAMLGYPVETEAETLYFSGSDCDAALTFPGRYPDVMEMFPPTLLISSTRDFAMSSVIATHSQLVSLGVEADLHLWDGREHAFLLAPNIPESRDAFVVIVDFFDKKLGRISV